MCIHLSETPVYNRKQSLVTHLHKIVTVFKKLMQKICVFYLKIALGRSAAMGSALKFPVLFCSHTALKNTRYLSCMFLNEFIN